MVQSVESSRLYLALRSENKLMCAAQQIAVAKPASVAAPVLPLIMAIPD